MDDTDRLDFGTEIAALAASFSRDTTQAMLHGFWLGLRDLQLDQLRGAVAKAITTSRYMPTPAELRSLAGAIDDATRATVAWDVVRRSISRYGVYRSVDFSDPMVNATIRNLGGWERLCGLPGEELEKWYRKDFEKTYLTLRAFDALAPDAGKHLPGIFEKTASGYAIEPPAKITVFPVGQQLAAEQRKELTHVP